MLLCHRFDLSWESFPNAFDRERQPIFAVVLSTGHLMMPRGPSRMSSSGTRGACTFERTWTSPLPPKRQAPSVTCRLTYGFTDPDHLTKLIKISLLDAIWRHWPHVFENSFDFLTFSVVAPVLHIRGRLYRCVCKLRSP